MTGEFAIAVHALVFLHHKGKVTSSEEIAENVCTNPARIRKVMSKLKKHGLIETKEGNDGGYLYHKDGREVTLNMIADALETEIVNAAWKSGNPEGNCQICSGMAGVMDGIYAALDQNCREYLKQITVEEIDGYLFREDMK